MLTLSIENSVKNLNPLDYYPLISSLTSSPIRILAATIQMVVGSVLAVLSIALGWLEGPSIWAAGIAVNIVEVAHGIGNLVRGIIAFIPFAGNLTLYLYDELSSRPVQPLNTSSST